MRRLGETLAAVVLVAVFVWWAAGLAFGGTVSGPVEPDSVGPVLHEPNPPTTTVAPPATTVPAVAEAYPLEGPPTSDGPVVAAPGHTG